MEKTGKSIKHKEELAQRSTRKRSRKGETEKSDTIKVEYFSEDDLDQLVKKLTPTAKKQKKTPPVGENMVSNNEATTQEGQSKQTTPEKPRKVLATKKPTVGLASMDWNCNKQDKSTSFRSNLKGIIKLVKEVKAKNNLSKIGTVDETTPICDLYNWILWTDPKLADFTKNDKDIVEIISRFNRRKGKFCIGGHELEITKRDVAIVFGISGGKKPIKLAHRNSKLNQKSNFVLATTRFPEHNRINKGILKQEILRLSGLTKPAPEDKQDYPRLVVLFILASLFVPTHQENFNWGYFRYVDRNVNMMQFDWAELFRDKLHSSLCVSFNAWKVKGCTALLPYWLMGKFKLVDPKDEKERMWCAKYDLQQLIVAKQNETKGDKSMNMNKFCTLKGLKEKNGQEGESEGGKGGEQGEEEGGEEGGTQGDDGQPDEVAGDNEEEEVETRDDEAITQEVDSEKGMDDDDDDDEGIEDNTATEPCVNPEFEESHMPDLDDCTCHEKNSKLSEEIKCLQKNLAECLLANKSLTKELRACNKKTERMTERIDQLDLDLNRERAEVKTLLKTQLSIARETKLAFGSFTTLKERNEELERERNKCEMLEKELNELKVSNKHSEETLFAAIDPVEARANSKKAKEQLAEMQGQLNSLKERCEQLQKEVEDLKNKEAPVEDTGNMSLSEPEGISVYLQHLNAKKNTLQKAILRLMLELKDLDNHLDSSKICLDQSLADLNTKQKNLECVQDSIVKSKRELDLVRESLEVKSVELETERENFRNFQQKQMENFEKIKEQSSIIRKEIKEKLEEVELREVKLGDEKKLMEVLLGKIEMEKVEFVGIQKHIAEKLNLIKLKEKSFVDSPKELEGRAKDQNSK